MKYIKNIIYSICFTAFFLNCSAPQQKIPRIEINYEAPEGEINLKEIASKLEIVRLETNDSVLIPEDFNLCIGDNYIVVVGDEAIHQFSRQGKYIRKIFNYGRGPEEVLDCSSQLIDNETGLYFITDNIYVGLLVYDLNKGKFLSRKATPYEMKLKKIDNNTLICYPNIITHQYTIPYSLCALNFNGEILYTLTDTVKNPVGSPITIGYSSENKLLLKNQKSDTVYTIENWKKIPAYTLHGKHSKVPAAIIEFKLLKENLTDYFFGVYPFIYKYNEKGQMTMMFAQGDKLFRVNKQTLKPQALTHIHIDTLDFNLSYRELTIGENNIFFTLSPLKFHKILHKKAEQQQLSLALQKIYDELSEDDNPLIFIAKNK